MTIGMVLAAIIVSLLIISTPWLLEKLVWFLAKIIAICIFIPLVIIFIFVPEFLVGEGAYDNDDGLD